MKPNKALENRLNAVKEGKDVPTPPDTDFSINDKRSSTVSTSGKNNKDNGIQNVLGDIKKHKKTITVKKIYTSIYELIGIGISSFIYGYAINIIFSKEWSILACFSIGYVFLNTLSFFSLLKQRKKK